MTAPHLFVDGEFVSHSGILLPFKLECDALTDSDIYTLANAIQRRVGAFGRVEGIPRGGLRLAYALDRYATKSPWDRCLVCDDVLTTGTSMEEAKAKLPIGTIGVVIFARGPYSHWIKPLFREIGR